MTTRTLLASFSSLALAATAAAAQQPERHTIAGDRVAIYDLVGQIRVEAGSGSGVIVEITRGGRDQGQLTVERGPVDALPGFETLRVVFPADDITYPPLGRRSRTEMTVRDDGTFGGDNSGERGRRWTRRSGRQVTISGSDAGLEAWADLRILVPAGRRLDVNVGVGDMSVTNVDGHLSLDGGSSTVTTRATKGSLNIDVGSGMVAVNDAQGDLSIDTGSGNVELTTFRGTLLTIDTGSGSVAVTGVVADAVNVDTGSGDITLTGITSPELNLDTGSGEVDVDVTTDVEKVNIDTGSGSVTLHVPDNVGAMVDIESGSGGVESDMPLEVTRWGSDHVTGRIGDGRGRIVVDTGSGRVRIVKRVK